jgi:hypothetical protein
MKKRIPFLLFLALYLAFSFATFRDYGCTWDEQDSYQGGAELYDYLVHGVVHRYLDPEHGYPYTCLLQALMGRSDFEHHHLANLLFAVLLFWAVFETLLSNCDRPWLSLSGPLFLFLDLPFLGSIPANPKDVPFAIFYFLGLSCMFLYDRLFPQGRFRWFFLGLWFGTAASCRIVGFTLFPILLAYDFYLFRREGGRIREPLAPWLGRKAPGWAGTFLLSQVLCMLFWPFIGRNYFKNLPLAFWLSAHFPPKFDFLFQGGISSSLTYPWYYLPLLIGITTPLFLLAFLPAAFFRSGNRTAPLLFLLASALGLNLALDFTLHPAVYDGLRHFLYLLPILCTLAAMGFIQAAGHGKAAVRTAAWALALLGAAPVAVQAVRLHPYEYVYYNELAGGFPGAYGRYETDYWVASMKEAVLWLRAHEIKDPAKTYRIYAQGKPFQSQAYFAPNMTAVDSPSKADFAILMTRAGTKPSPGDLPKVIHRVEREGTPLCFILKMR